ncbi:MAG: hypothetical protein PHN38_06365 [Sulfurospirillaceae bacterium]|nr:hypothetical protein [Sulfurospirillaceae bacterium]
MQVLKLEVHDAIFDKVISFLKNFPQNQVKLDIEKQTSNKPKKLKSISLRTKDFRFDRDEANAR